MGFTVKKNLLYFISGMVVCFLILSTTYIICLIALVVISVIYGKKIMSFHCISKRLIYPPSNNHKVNSMAIINGIKSTKKEKIKVTISSDIVAKINEYCQWANIEDVGFFIEEAALFVFSKDKEWKDNQRTIKRAKKQEANA